MSDQTRYDRMRESIRMLLEELSKEEKKQADFQKSLSKACLEAQQVLCEVIPMAKVTSEHKKTQSEIFVFEGLPNGVKGLAFLVVRMEDNLSQEEIAENILKAVKDKLLQPFLDKKSKMLR